MNYIQKRELENKLLDLIEDFHLVNIIDLIDFLKLFGGEYGITNINDVNDVVGDNVDTFRMYFDSNYQLGYRAKYATTINTETGEINIGLAEKAEMESAKDEQNKE